LFTTYTQALIRFSEQLLEQLMGKDAHFVHIRTADSVAMGLLKERGTSVDVIPDKDLKYLFTRAIDEADLQGNALQRRAQRLALERLGVEFLLDEITWVIDGRRLASLEDYWQAKRTGRQVRLNKTQREAIWKVHERFQDLVKQDGQVTWAQLRAMAADAAGRVREHREAPYDAVVVDEAQDLQAASLQMLVHLCKQPNMLFLTADANQSIYGPGFRWQDVHDQLRFQGRTGILKANYRSTKEIGEAALDYLRAGGPDVDADGIEYLFTGALPAVRAVPGSNEEILLLHRFIQLSSHELRVTPSSCAILVPSRAEGKRIAAELSSRGLTAQFMEGKQLDLRAPVIKVLTLKSAKGLEFPSVAIAGMVNNDYLYSEANGQDTMQEELLLRERRTLYVAMTRAMRVLLVIVPAHEPSVLLQGFNNQVWNMGTS
jgi:superfamily I DNA/RNA helicase